MSKEPSSITKVFRIACRGLPLAAFVFGCFLELIFCALVKQLEPPARARILQKWCRRVSSALHLRYSIEGPIPDSGLIVSNHLSYLDILVFSAAAQTCFVSKDEVRSWPLVGWAAALAGTIFIDRSRAAATQEIQSEMQAALSAGVRLVLFPEGTSSSGEALLPFRSSLFQPAIDLKTPITGAAIDYRVPDGDSAKEVCYWGEMTLAPHLIHLLTKKRIDASLRFSPEHYQFQDRKEAARVLQSVIENLRPQAAQVQSPRR